VRHLAFLIAALLVAACGPGTTTPADVTPDPAAATATSGRFSLSLTVDRTTLRTGDNISGRADLTMIAGTTGVLSGPTEIVAFEFIEIGGQQRRVLPANRDMCAPHQLGSDSPLTTEMYKSGGFSDADPNAGFVRDFLQGPEIRLPAGEWDISAIATFSEGRDCAAQPHAIRATVRVHVT
jgi:hypothetical protein